jgi:phosphoglycolate phosphatase
MFHRVYGSDLAGKNADKADLIAHVIERERLTPSQVYMIGDRAHDITGGRTNSTRTIGVLWGYGSEEKIRNARPDVVVDSMTALLAAIKSARIAEIV